MSQLGGFASYLGSPMDLSGEASQGPAPGYSPQNFGPQSQPQQQQSAASPTRGGKVPQQLRPAGYQNPAMQGVPGVNTGAMVGRIQGMQDVTPAPPQSAALANYLGRGTGAPVDQQAALKQYLMQQGSQPAMQFNGQQMVNRSFDNPLIAQLMSGGSVPNGSMLMSETSRQMPAPLSYEKIMAQTMPMLPLTYTNAEGMEAARIAAPYQAQAAMLYQQQLHNQQQYGLGLSQQALQGQLGMGDLALRGQQMQGQMGLGQKQLALEREKWEESKSPDALIRAAITANVANGGTAASALALRGALKTAMLPDQQPGSGGVFSSALGGGSGVGANPSPATNQGSAGIGNSTQENPAQTNPATALTLAAPELMAEIEKPSYDNAGGAFAKALGMLGQEGVKQNFPMISRYLDSRYGNGALERAVRPGFWSHVLNSPIAAVWGSNPWSKSNFYTPEGRASMDNALSRPFTENLDRQISVVPSQESQSRALARYLLGGGK